MLFDGWAGHWRGPWDALGKRHLTFLSAAYVPPTLFNPLLTILFAHTYHPLFNPTTQNANCSQRQILPSSKNRLTDYGPNSYSRIMSLDNATLTLSTKIDNKYQVRLLLVLLVQTKPRPISDLDFQYFYLVVFLISSGTVERLPIPFY